MQTQIQKNPNPGSTILVARIIWLAMFVAVGSLYFAAYMDEMKRDEPVTLTYGEIFAQPLVQQIFLTALIAAVTAFFGPRYFVRLFGGFGQGSKLQKGFGALILRLALSESVSVFGLVAFMIVHSTLVMHPFLAISVLLFLISFPTQELLEDFAS